jgi:hypothetical protein
MMTNKCLTHHKNNLLCKDKWGVILGKFKKIYDCMVRTKHNEKYWSMTIANMVAFNLPKNFDRGMYEMIDEFLNMGPIFNPPHMRNSINDACDIYISIWPHL